MPLERRRFGLRRNRKAVSQPFRSPTAPTSVPAAEAAPQESARVKLQPRRAGRRRHRRSRYQQLLPAHLPGGAAALNKQRLPTRPPQVPMSSVTAPRTASTAPGSPRPANNTTDTHPLRRRHSPHLAPAPPCHALAGCRESQNRSRGGEGGANCLFARSLVRRADTETTTSNARAPCP